MKRHTQDQMHSLCEQWQASGESKTVFALRHGIRPTTFYYWVKKFEQGSSLPTSGFQQVSMAEPTVHNQGELLAAIQYPSGIRLELYSSFQSLDKSYVELLKTLTA
ncbi:MAG: helix-turn-helix domain-containing protein [Marinoscillum sp.]